MEGFAEFCPEGFVGFGSASKTSDIGGGRQIAVYLEIVKGGNKFSEGQVTGSAKNDDIAGAGKGAVGKSFLKGVDSRRR